MYTRRRRISTSPGDSASGHGDGPPPGSSATRIATPLAFLCFVPDAGDGAPHFVHGMMQEYVVT